MIRLIDLQGQPKTEISLVGIASCPFPTKGISKFVDITGVRCGTLLVLSYAGRSMWNCLCDCGSIKPRDGKPIRRGIAKSCGCITNVKHGVTKNAASEGISREYRAWDGMKGRCMSPSNKGYKNYGKRGIRVCDRWAKSFDNFLNDMGLCPRGLTLDRIDVNGNYEPGNCRWATWEQQANNKQNTVWLRWNGSLITIRDAATITGIKIDTIRNRINQKWTVERALTTPDKTSQA